MLTTIFTGHTLNLTDIVAIGKIKTFMKGGLIQVRTLEMMIHLKHGANPIQYVGLQQVIMGGGDADEKEQLENRRLLLEQQRAELLQIWSVATGQPVNEEVSHG